MIFKLTKEYDKWGNLYKNYFQIVEKLEFKENTTKYPNGSKTETELHEVVNMSEIFKLITPEMFENYTEYGIFLITTEASFKAKKGE